MTAKQKIILGVFSASACEFFFGFSFFFTKKITNTVCPMELLSWRFTLGFLVMTLCLLTGAIKINMKGKKILPLLLLGLLFPGIYFITEAYGIQMTTASESGIVISTVPAVTLLLAVILLKEKPTKFQVLGILLSIIGVLFCVLNKGLHLGGSLLGYILLFTAVLCFCFFTIIANKMQQYSSMEKTYFILLSASVVFTITAFIRAVLLGRTTAFLMLPFSNMNFLTAVLYLGLVCSMVSLFLVNLGVALIGPSSFSVFIGVETVVSVMAGVLILKEPFSILQMLGAVLVIIGVYLANSCLQNNRENAEK